MASQLFMEKSEPAKQLVNAPSTFPPAEQGKDTNQTDKSQPLTSAPMQANIEQSPYQQQPPYQSYPYQQAWGYQQWPFPHNLHPYQHPYGFQPQRGHGDRGHYHYGKHGHGWGRHHERRGHHEDRGWQHEGRGNQEWRNNARRQEQGQYDAQQQHSQYYGFPPNQQPMMHGYYPNQAPQHVQPPPPTHYMPPQHHPPQFWPPCWQGERRGKRGRRGGCGKGRRGRSSSHSRSNSSSSSSSSESKQKKGAQNTKKAESIRYQQQISGNYKNQMKNFFQSRNVNEKQEGKIIELLKRNYPAFDAPIPLLLQCVQFAQKEKLLFRMSYVKVMKVLIRCGLDLSQAIPKLLRIQEHKLRKFQADEQFAQKYGKQAQTPLLEVNELILMQADTRPTLFLVDGNNILPTNKHLRRYFQSRRPLDRVLGQMRARWYISHCFQPGQVVLFFDERFQDAEYQLAQQCTFPDEHEQLRASQIQVVYGEESKADDKIVQRLKEVSQGKEKAEVVLVSADRELGMRCQQIRPVLHTSGKYFFKFCKYVLSRKYKGDKMLKRMARGINCYEEENSRVLK